jgi:AraC-like DNA-binding protein
MMSSRQSSFPSACAPVVEFWRDADLPFCEGRRAVGSVTCYAPHTHPTFSIGVVDAGTSTFSLPHQQQRKTQIRPGDVVLIGADEVHSCNPSDRESWGYRMFHLDRQWLLQLLQESGIDALPASQVLRSPRAVALMDDITAAMSGKDDALQKETVLIATLCELFGICREADVEIHQVRSADLQSVRDYLQAHCCDKIALETLAQLAGVGRYHLIRQFRAQFGMTPHALQLDMRINLARDFLRRGASLADVAYRTGFADQSHFHRIFKSRVAATPAQYQLSA